jgi:hypothetical protein
MMELCRIPMFAAVQFAVPNAKIALVKHLDLLIS